MIKICILHHHFLYPGIGLIWSAIGWGFLLIRFAAVVYGQEITLDSYKEAGLPFIQNYDAKTYNGHQQNWAVLQDNRGVLYVGNLPGLLEFDGVNWRKISVPNNSVVRSLAMDTSGTVYVGAHADFGFLAPDSAGVIQYHSLLHYVPESERTFTNVWKVHTTPDGIYFRTASHLFRWSDQRMHVWKPPSEFHRSFWVRDALFIRDWDVGLLTLVGDSLVLTPGGEQFVEQRVDVMLPYGADEILLGTRTSGLFLLNEATYSPFSTEADAFLRQNQIYDALLLRDNTMAFATLRGGLARIDSAGRLLNIVDKESGLQDNTIWSMGADHEGGLWLSLNKGISRVELPSAITTFTDRQGLEGTVESVALHNNALYAGTSLGVYRMIPSERTGYSPSFKAIPRTETQVWSLHSDGESLLAATSRGILQLEASTVQQITSDISFFLHLSNIDTNRIYVALSNGVGVLERSAGTWQFAGRLPGISEETRTIAEDENGNLWVGSQFSGVLRVEAPSPRRLPSPKDTTLRITRFDASHDMPQGEIKVGSLGKRIVFDTSRGLLTFDAPGQRFVYDSPIHSYFGDSLLTIRQVYEDHLGRHWTVRTGGGSRRFSLVTPGNGGGFEASDMPMDRLVDQGKFWAMFADPRDTDILWLGGDEGLIRFDARVPGRNSEPYSAWIRRVSVDRDSLIYGGAPVQSGQINSHVFTRPELPTNSTLRFEYAVSSFDMPALNQYQYMLEGFDKEWSVWSEETVREYTSLPAKSYRFRVRAKNGYQQISNEDVYEFTVLPPWYMTWWAYVLYTLPLLLILYGVDRFQRSRVVKGERVKAEIEQAKLRTAAAEFQSRTLQAENELLNAELKFLSVVESANDAIISANQKGEIIFWNREAERIFGYSRDEVLGSSLHVIMPERHRLAHEKGLERYMRTGEPQAIGRVLELEGVRKGGEEFPLELSLSSWKTDEGTFFSAILRDITQRKESEEVLRRIQNQLTHAEKMASLGKITAGIAHEIRNPLNFVNNFAELMEDLVDDLMNMIDNNREKPLGELGAEIQTTLHYLKTNAASINKHGAHADRIVRSMMDHVRRGYGGRQETLLNKLVADAIERAHTEWSARNDALEINIQEEFDQNIEWIEMLPREMEQVIVNILDNAFDALLEKARTGLEDFDPTVLVSTLLVNNHAQIHIRDNGMGMKKEAQENIFEPFFTTKPTGTGTGLGLSLSYDIVTNGHGGSIQFESTSGEGAHFVLEVPIEGSVDLKDATKN